MKAFITTFVLFIFLIFSFETYGQQGSISPKTNNGKKWRIGYFEGGPYDNYQEIFLSLINNLTRMGWIETSQFPQPSDDTENRTLWSWLSTHVRSDYLEFVADGFWSAEWKQDMRRKTTENIISRLNTQKDIDLMLAFGTWAGLDMANNRHSVPTLIFSSSDPVRAGIVKSADDSGYDHLHARVDPKRYERQIRLFHSIIKFKKLGIVFQDTPTARTYSAVDDIIKVAEEKGFKIIECTFSLLKSSPEEAKEKILSCYQNLAPQIDAFYITDQIGVNQENLPELLEPMFKHRVPTFTQRKTKDVKYGVLLSLAQENYKDQGRFHAETFAQVLNGKKPRELTQIYEDSQEIAINLETAKRIGFRLPLDVIAGAKEIYKRIETPARD